MRFNVIIDNSIYVSHQYDTIKIDVDRREYDTDLIAISGYVIYPIKFTFKRIDIYKEYVINADLCITSGGGTQYVIDEKKSEIIIAHILQRLNNKILSYDNILPINLLLESVISTDMPLISKDDYRPLPKNELKNIDKKHMSYIINSNISDID